MRAAEAAEAAAGEELPPRRLVQVRTVFAALTLLCAAAVPVVFLLGHAPVVTGATGAALALQTLLCLLLALTHRERPPGWHRALRTAGLVVLGLLTAAPGYFFGPNSAFAAFVALVLVLTGVLAGAADDRRPAIVGWLVYLALALGQAAVLTLVLIRRLPDASLTVVIIEPHPMWHHAISHAALQVVYLATFLSGRVFQRRYGALARQVEEAARLTARREILLEEARAEYKRTLAAGRSGMFSAGAPGACRPGVPPGQGGMAEATIPTCGPPPGEDEVLAGMAPGGLQPAFDGGSAEAGAPAGVDDSPPSFPLAEGSKGDASMAPATVWQDAYRSKMRGFFAGIVGLSAGGGLLLSMIGRERGPLVFGLGCIAGIVAAAWLQRFLTARRPQDSIYWPWALVGVLSIGPAYSLGLHSAFAAVLVLWMFAGGIFRAAQRSGWLDRRGHVLAGILLAHTGLFVLILLGVVPDDGNVAVLQQGSRAWELVIRHALVMSAYAASFFAGLTVDRRYEALTRRVEAAVRSVARQEALLATVRTQLDIALTAGGGIFTGQHIGRYRVGRLLGRGGMGEVYEATQGDGGARVALKLIRGDRAAKPEFLQMFLKEGRTLNLVRSPCVARVLDVSGDNDELPFVALEYIEGRTLVEILREREQLSLAEVREMVRDVGRGLQDVHEAGILHRDIKPSNVIRTASTGPVRWKLVDFGIARPLSPEAAAAGLLVMGTPAYMSPEQARGERLDVRSDIYSLALVIYRALAGRPAFTGHDPAEVARAALAGGPPDPRTFVELPDYVVLALRLGLAAMPEDRFASAAEITLAFEEAIEGRLSAEHRRRALDLLRRCPWSR